MLDASSSTSFEEDWLVSVLQAGQALLVEVGQKWAKRAFHHIKGIILVLLFFGYKFKSKTRNKNGNFNIYFCQ